MLRRDVHSRVRAGCCANVLMKSKSMLRCSFSRERKIQVGKSRKQKTEKNSSGCSWGILAAAGILLAVTALLCTVLFCRRNAAGERRDGGQCVVEVATDLHRGQGVVFAFSSAPDGAEGAWFLITAGHVADGMQEGEQAQIGMADGRTGEAQLLYRSETADMAILYMRENQVQGSLDCAERNREAFDAAAEGDAVYARYVTRKEGVPREDCMEGTLLDTWVYLEDFALDMMLAKLPARSGMSGCGIFDGQGNFMGILCGVSAEGEAAVLPLSVIESEWLLQGSRAE